MLLCLTDEMMLLLQVLPFASSLDHENEALILVRTSLIEEFQKKSVTRCLY